jgi:hypothetical protein
LDRPQRVVLGGFRRQWLRAIVEPWQLTADDPHRFRGFNPEGDALAQYPLNDQYDFIANHHFLANLATEN